MNNDIYNAWFQKMVGPNMNIFMNTSETNSKAKHSGFLMYTIQFQPLSNGFNILQVDLPPQPKIPSECCAYLIRSYQKLWLECIKRGSIND